MIIHSGENPNNYNNYLLSGVKKVVKNTICKEHTCDDAHSKHNAGFYDVYALQPFTKIVHFGAKIVREKKSNF